MHPPPPDYRQTTLNTQSPTHRRTWSVLRKPRHLGLSIALLALNCLTSTPSRADFPAILTASGVKALRLPDVRIETADHHDGSKPNDGVRVAYLDVQGVIAGSIRFQLLLPDTWATVAYYEEVLQRDPKAMEYARLFLVPGCYHCGGGPGVSRVDWLQVIVDWVETGSAPDRIIARKSGQNGAPAMTRPLVPYPERVEYRGSGDTNDVENFVLRTP